KAISLTNNYEFSFLPRGALCTGLVQEFKTTRLFFRAKSLMKRRYLIIPKRNTAKPIWTMKKKGVWHMPMKQHLSVKRSEASWRLI
ncbi:MAG TPA: hypothetical protein PKO23_18055, partial [Candidatus Hydrogenedentes bacterium]|nr:hypothetical protein [Candidatus Hydrogenedentota bacterium]